MRILIFVGVAALGLAACSGPTLNGQNDTAQAFPGVPHTIYPTGPYDNTGRGPQSTGLNGGGG
jgi:hypothetical protein